jgi:hypothetical protein
MTDKDSSRPKPSDQEDADRWEATALKHRILTSQWTQDAEEALQDYFAIDARDALPDADISRNPALSIYSQISAPHEDAPSVTVSGGMSLDPMRLDLVWPLMPREDLLAVAMGEMLRRLDVVVSARRVSMRSVTPDCVIAYATADDPTRPALVEELRWRLPLVPPRPGAGDVKPRWTWEVWDVRDPAAPRFVILDERRNDVTADYTEPGWPDLYRDTAGNPVLPYVVRHAEVGSTLWDWRRGMEIFKSTLRVSAMWTWWVMLARDTSSPQRVLVDGDVLQTGTAQGANAAPTLQLNPLMIARVRSENGRQASLDAWDARSSPTDYALALAEYERPLSAYAGLTPADVTHGQASSGYAIVVSRDGQRRAQRRSIPGARMADQEMLATMARLGNRSFGWGLPESPDDYEINYGSVGRSLEEIATESKTAIEEVGAGLRHPADVVQIRRPSLSREAAMLELIEARRDRALLEAVTLPGLDAEALRATVAALREAVDTGADARELIADLAELLGEEVDDDATAPPEST